MIDRRRVMTGYSFRDTVDKETVKVIGDNFTWNDDGTEVLDANPVTKSGSFLATKIKIVIDTINTYDGANITITTQNGTNNVSLSGYQVINHSNFDRNIGAYVFQYSTTEDNPYISYQITAKGGLQYSTWSHTYGGYPTTITLYSNEE